MEAAYADSRRDVVRGLRQFLVGTGGRSLYWLATARPNVEAREVNASLTDDEELRSPYVHDDQLDIGRWAHDATILALPTRILCRPDCLGLCPTCGVSLNDADPADHIHESAKDPRWAALDNLKLE